MEGYFTMDIFIWPYSIHSKSSKLLAESMDVNRIRRTGSSVVDKKDRLIINWGDSTRCPYTEAKVLNKPEAVEKAVNKQLFFRFVANHNSGKSTKDSDWVWTPPYSLEWSIAEGWIERGYKICSRSVLDGNSGSGLVISDKKEDHPQDAGLYTRYINKLAEYRVHVIDDLVVEVQKKVWPSHKSSVGVDFTQRNHNDGFVFQSAKFHEVKPDIIRQAKAVIKVIGLDFGGVDVIEDAHGQVWVLEVNTAPGIEGRDLEVYGRSFRDIANRLSQS